MFMEMLVNIEMEQNMLVEKVIRTNYGTSADKSSR